MEIVSGEDLSRQFAEDLAMRPKRCFIQGDYIHLNTEPATCTGATYPIHLDRLDTYPKLLGWTMHLLEKNWVTPDQLDQFIRLVCDHYDLPIETCA